MLKIYNSLTRTKEVFTPIHPGKIGIYVCGMTVYDVCHLGHARSMVCFDAIVRFLRSKGFVVDFVRNITDIEDKIIKRAHEQNMTIDELTKRYITTMHDDAKALNILPPSFEPRATEHMNEILQLIQRLIDAGYAYIADNGDVCYQVEKFKDYGKLSNRDLEGLISGKRVEVVREKRSPLDFVLWKKAKPSEPSWPSTWGDGRPGWHIECSAMAMCHLSEQFDIHGGGLDLLFPHHENEVAQSEAATGKTFANYWMHVGLLQINNEKMAKSTGNFLTIDAALKKHHAETIRYFLLSSHYRSPLNYSETNIMNAHKALTRLYQALKEVTYTSKDSLDDDWAAEFTRAMDDDFNTPVALSVLFNLSHAIHKTKKPSFALTLKHLAGTLGLMQVTPESFLQDCSLIDKLKIDSLIQERLEARTAHNWQRSDEIRDFLEKQGIVLEDGKNATSWRKIND